MTVAVREIVRIDEELCDGCGLCIPSCAEGAIQMINGKAKLINDSLCDGIGNCLGECPQGAITITRREAADYDEQAVEEHLAQLKKLEAGLSVNGNGAGAAISRKQVAGPAAHGKTDEPKPAVAATGGG